MSPNNARFEVKPRFMSTHFPIIQVIKKKKNHFNSEVIIMDMAFTQRKKLCRRPHLRRTNEELQPCLFEVEDKAIMN